jgi:hypothetical protein
MTRIHSVATAKVGLIARGASPSHSPASDGSLNLDLANPGFFVTAVDESAPAVGDTVCKTGQTSGTTCGAITSSCTALPGEFSDVVRICQMVAHMRSRGNDSGSPIYHWASSSDSTVTLAGILWGGPNNADSINYTYYSQWDWVLWELFRADTVNVLADTPYTVYNNLGGKVSGPNDIGVADTYLWTAQTFGGNGSYTYQWKYQNSGSGTWTSLGTSATQTRGIGSDTLPFTLRAIVTSGGETDTSNLLVNVDIISGVDISGPTWVHPGQVCSWTATPTGGTQPYSYAWDGGGDDSDTFGVYVLESLSVGVTVYAANGGQTYSSVEVYVDESGAGC